MMERVGCCDEDRIDAAGCRELGNVAIGAHAVELRGEGARLLEAASRASHQPRSGRLDDGRGDQLGDETAETDDAPADG